MSRAVVIGQSHSAALAQALLTERTDVSGISVHRLEDRKRPYEREVIKLDDAVSMVQGLPAETRVFLSTLGTYHNIWGLLRSGPAFDFLLDPGDSPDPSAEIHVPHRAIASAFDQHLAKPSLVRKIQSAAKSRVYLLSGPPPKQNNDFMLERFMAQKKQSYRGISVGEVGLERPETRLKLWLMETRATARWAASEDLHFVPAPAESFDENGFLHPQFYSDATHANAGYGALVIDQISAIIEEAFEEPARG